MLYSGFLLYTWCLFSISGCHPGYDTLSHLVSLGASWQWQFLTFFFFGLFLLTLIVLRRTGQILCRMPTIGIVCCFSQDRTGVMGLGEEDHRDEVPFSSHHSMCRHTYCLHDWWLLTLISVIWLTSCLSSLSTATLLLFFVLSLLGGKSLCTAHI